MRQVEMFGKAPLPKGFDDFWAAFPRREGKLDAMRAFQAAIKAGYKADDLIAGAKGYAALCKREGRLTQYTLLPGTWIRRGGWMDDNVQPDKGVTQEMIDAAADKADRLLKRGAYAVKH